MTALKLGFSPCPNDTFIFHALVNDRVDPGRWEFDVRLEDVETLNRLAAQGALDVAKVSFGALPRLLDEYALLRSGGALGRGCGPLVVTRNAVDLDALRQMQLAIPGRSTTANLLWRMFAPDAPEGRELRYEQIMPAVAAGEVEAGLIIHESRFTYPDHGLVKAIDLGEWWEQETGAPIPLGAIVARRSLGPTVDEIESAIRRSVQMAYEDPSQSRAYIRENAQEMDERVTQSHIGLYVNEHSIDIGPAGEQAIRQLFERGRQTGWIPEAGRDPFARISAK